MDTPITQDDQSRPPTLIIGVEALNITVNAAMFDLCRACAADYLTLPKAVLEAYTDRDHSKFDLHLWQSYLDGLMWAIRNNLSASPRRVRRAYRAVMAAQLMVVAS